MGIAENIQNIKSKITANVKLVAVSKTQSIDAINEAYNAGQRLFGENKVQELTEKYELLQKPDINWHLIGHLQTNKVKYIAPFVDLIHSVDSLKLLLEINKQAQKNSRVINCLLQFHIASEETKFGLNYDEATFILESNEFKLLKNINICGIMGMASYSNDKNLIKEEFKSLKDIYIKLKDKYFANNSNFSEISMGMSSDWDIAITEGSTIIRIGSTIFGSRNYNKNT